MSSTQKCPLCNENSTFTYGKMKGKEAKFITCPRCKKLSFEDGAEDIVLRAGETASKEFKAMASKTTGNKFVHFSLNYGLKNMKGVPQIIFKIIDPNCL